jgi:plasmid stability protein
MQRGEVVVWMITDDSMLSSGGLAFNSDVAILPSMSHKTRDFLIRGLPVELANKVKIAAGLHGQSMQRYVQALLAEHVKALEKKGITLSLPKGKG